MSVANLLTQTCTIKRKTAVSNATTGGTYYTYADLATGVACCVQANSAYQSNQAMREIGEQGYSGFFANSTDIRVDDRIVLTTGPQANVEFDVRGNPIDHAGRFAYYFVPLSRRDGGAQS